MGHLSLSISTNHKPSIQPHRTTHLTPRGPKFIWKTFLDKTMMHESDKSPPTQIITQYIFGVWVSFQCPTISYQNLWVNSSNFEIFFDFIFSKMYPEGLNFKILNSDWSKSNCMLFLHFLCTLVSYSSRINRCPVFLGTARRRWGGPKES